MAKEDLIAAANAANRGDAASRAFLQELYQGRPDVLEIYAAVGHVECGRVQAAWRQAVTEYEKTWQTALTYGVPEKLKPDLAVVMPSLLLVVLSGAFQKELKAEIQ